MKNQLNDITDELSLAFYDGQDWGIVNSDDERVIEFINYFRNFHKTFEAYTKECFVELIVSSLNDFLEEKKIDIELLDLFNTFKCDFLNDDTFQFTLDYWKELDSNEFPVVKYLY